MKHLGEKSMEYQSSLPCASVDSWNLLLGLSVCLSVFLEKRERVKMKPPNSVVAWLLGPLLQSLHMALHRLSEKRKRPIMDTGSWQHLHLSMQCSSRLPLHQGSVWPLALGGCFVLVFVIVLAVVSTWLSSWWLRDWQCRRLKSSVYPQGRHGSERFLAQPCPWARPWPGGTHSRGGK